MNPDPLYHLAQRSDLTVVLDAVITSVPVEYERSASHLEAGRNINHWRTRFFADCSAIHVGAQQVITNGRIRVLLNGQASGRIGRGDRIRMTGQLSWPGSLGNPGEFDFGTYLLRRNCAGILFVSHLEAVQILRPAGPMSAGYWITRLRRAAQSALNGAVDREYRGIAVALLLGSRSEIRAETEDIFIQSGTMHLLAISGLHIGILCLLLIRLGHWLLIPWNRCLIAIAVFCIFYAFMTDLRPSVVRATVFAVLFTLSQVTLRQVSFPAIIGQAGSLMLLCQPYLVFDTGAWLSFLSVMGLAVAGSTVQSNVLHDRMSDLFQENRVPLTPWEHVRKAMLQIRNWLVIRYRPMLWIMATTIPLTAWAFHVVSPVGLIVNVFLIAYTMLTLWLGFAAIALGMLIPFVPNLPGTVFSWMLAGLSSMVEVAANIGVGHLYLADLPFWCLPMWYCLLVTVVMFRNKRQKQIIWLCLCGLTAVTFLGHSGPDSDGSLHCTILDVGHGSAAVVELPDGRVMVVDAGAMNRGDQAGELVSRCLWQRGHRIINSIIVSHADADHFNALGKVLPRFPVGELLLSQQFLRSESTSVVQLIKLAVKHDIPIRVAGNDQHFRSGAVEIQILQASPDHLAYARSDNEKSLVIQIRFAGRTILLPGDLEDVALIDVLSRLPQARVLVSPIMVH